MSEATPEQLGGLQQQVESQAPDAAHSLRVLSWNVHGLPFQSSTMTRLQRIGGKIRELRPDVVLLQEVWFGMYARALRRALQAEYEAVSAARRITRWPRGGLLAFIRRRSGWVAVDWTFVRYEARAPWYHIAEGDGIAGKGALAVELRRGRQSLTVVDTHLQAQYPHWGRRYPRQRQAQLQQLNRFLDRSFAAAAVLIAGDFNTSTSDDPCASALAPVGRDLTVEERNSCRRGTHFDTASGHNEWIDYVMVRNVNVHAEVERIENTGADRPYSDHDGILVRLTYDGGQLQRGTL